MNNQRHQDLSPYVVSSDRKGTVRILDGVTAMTDRNKLQQPLQQQVWIPSDVAERRWVKGLVFTGFKDIMKRRECSWYP
jgi:hypothetical protein